MTNKICTTIARTFLLGFLFSISANAGEESQPLPIELPDAFFGGTPDIFWSDELEEEFRAEQRAFIAPEGASQLSNRKPVTASAAPLAGELAQITDGNKDYLRQAVGAGPPVLVELPEGLQWIQIDLGTPRELFAVVIWHHLQRRICYDVVAQVSDDPEFKKEVTTIYNNDSDNSSALGVGKDKEYIESNKGRLIDARGVIGRYLRVYGKGSTASDFNHFIEVEVWGR